MERLRRAVCRFVAGWIVDDDPDKGPSRLDREDVVAQLRHELDGLSQ